MPPENWWRKLIDALLGRWNPGFLQQFDRKAASFIGTDVQVGSEWSR